MGDGAQEDESEAAKWYRRAAEQGHAGAQYELGVCYYDGEGVEENEEEALKWFRKAAAQGNADAKKKLQEIQK